MDEDDEDEERFDFPLPPTMAEVVWSDPDAA